jgi:general secretion pathway protein F
MRTFRYRAVTSNDRAEYGVVEAVDDRDAALRLLDRGLYPVNISMTGRSMLDILSTPISTRALSAPETAQVLADLGHLVNAGVEVAPALAIISSTNFDSHRRLFFVRLVERVRVGRALSDALSEFGALFPAHVIAAVRAGEISGGLGRALVRIAETQRRTLKLRSQFRTALIYPTCVAVGVTAALFVLVGVVVPTLEQLFSHEIHRLPGQTRFLVLIGRAVRDNAALIAIGAASLAVIIAIGLRRAEFRKHIELLVLRIPIAGRLLSAAETARIAVLLAMLASAGLPLVSAVTLVQDSARLAISRDALLNAVLRLREGACLYDALSDVPTLSGRVLALIRIGEMTARLGPLLEEAARDAEYQVSTAIERALSLITPAMTLLFGGIAGFVLYAVMTAILSVNDLAMRGG